MKLLSIDPSVRSTGICLVNTQTKQILLSTLQPPKDYRTPLAILFTLIHLQTLIKMSDHVTVEDEPSIPHRLRTAMLLANLHGALQYEILRHGKPILYVATSQLRSYHHPHKFKGKLADLLKTDVQSDQVDAAALAVISLAAHKFIHPNKHQIAILKRLRHV